MSSKENKKIKVAKKQKEVSFPDDWPIDTSDPSKGLDQPTLAPGSLLHGVSGADVFIAKSASQKKTLQQQFLCLLPGNLQMNGVAKPVLSQSQLSQTQVDDIGDDDDDEDVEEAENGELHDNKEDGDGATSKQKVAPSATILGRMKSISTQPTLSLTVGQDPNAATLQFTGQHVASTSKFLVISIQPKKKKQCVTVKHVFNSLVVFGTPSLYQDHDTITTSTSETADAGSDENGELDHYGGSSRAANSGAISKWIRKSSSKSTNNGTKPLDMPAHEDGDDNSSQEDSADVDMNMAAPARSSISRRAKSKRKSLTEESDEDADENNDDQLSNPQNESDSDASVTVIPRSRPPPRQPLSYNSVSKSKANGNKGDGSDPSSSDSDAYPSSNSDEDDSSVDFGTKKKPITKKTVVASRWQAVISTTTPGKKHTPTEATQPSKSSSADKKSAGKQITKPGLALKSSKGESEYIVTASKRKASISKLQINDSSDDESDHSEVEMAKKRPRRTARKANSVIEINSDDDTSESETSQSVAKVKGKAIGGNDSDSGHSDESESVKVANDSDYASESDDEVDTKVKSGKQSGPAQQRRTQSNGSNLTAPSQSAEKVTLAANEESMATANQQKRKLSPGSSVLELLGDCKPSAANKKIISTPTKKPSHSNSPPASGLQLNRRLGSSQKKKKRNKRKSTNCV